MTRLLAALLFCLLAAPASAQGLYNLGFTLDGRIGAGWIETPLGVVSEYDYSVWRLTLRGVVPVAEVLRDRLVGRAA